jgi:hypothetical protein
MTFPDPELNTIYDFNSTYPYNVGPNPFVCQGADIVSAYDKDYDESPQDVLATFPPLSLHEILFGRSPLPLFNCLRKMEDALPEELL